MTHTSGLSYGFLNPAINSYYEESGVNDFANQTLEDFARKAASVPLLCEPGTQWNYSISMDVLGRVVEVASGLRYDVYLEKNLFRPLGRVDSGFYVPEEKLDRFAQVYTHNADKTGMVVMDDPLVGGFKTPPMMASGGGGMVGTIGDYYRFAQMLANRGELDGVRVLSEQSAWDITRDHLGPGLGEMPLSTLLNARVTVTDSGESAEESEPSGLRAMIFRGMGFGYCGAVVRPSAMPIFGSAGTYWWGGLASTDFWIDPQENIVAVFCTQLIPAGTYPTKVAFSGAVYKSLKEKRVGAEVAATASMAN
jgi:CubicO group peptidase (beta-lactamase class C family)